MDDARWDKVEALFDAALEQPPGERRAWLVRACADDELRREVEGMVAAHDRTAGVLEQRPDVEATRTLPPSRRPAIELRTVGPYQLLSQAGRGGMGIVYKAHDPRLDRDVALKFLPRQHTDPDAVKRFLAEAKAASALDHPSICTIYDVGETGDGQLYIAMAYYEGETLAEKIARGPLAVDDAVELAVQVAEGLARAHAAGIVHRDVKPANLMLPVEVSSEHRRRDRASAGRIKILDFGIAKLEGSTLTRSGMTPGTLAYMAPEQIDGDDVDHRADLWSLGVVLYEMLAGKLPFDDGSRGAVIRSILSSPPRALRSLRPEVPGAVERVVEKALSKRPADRHASAGGLAAELEEARHEEARDSPPAGSQRVERHRYWRWAVAAAALALAVLAGVWGAGREEAPAAVDPAVDVERPRASVAVLYFENLSGDAELDWLRHGLTDMLVTDLSQSPEIRVLSTDRLYQILSELGRLDERVTSSEALREVAERAHADTVIVGSFARLGETIRVSIKVREAASGEITASQKVDARGEGELFTRVDELSRQLRLGFELPLQSEVVADRDLSEVTTSSVAAYRYYLEGEKLLRLSRYHEAIALFDKAVEIDPDFAMAHVKLSQAHEPIRHRDESREHARRALEGIDRLSAPERAAVEGRYYQTSLETFDRAIETYRQALELYPHLDSLRAELAKVFFLLKMYDEVVEQLELLRAKGSLAVVDYYFLALAYTHCEELEQSIRVLAESRHRFPENTRMYIELAAQLIRAGRLDEAEAAVRRGEELHPGNYHAHEYVAWQLHVLREEWERAEDVSQLLGRSPELSAQVERLRQRACVELHRGRPSAAAELLEQLVGIYPEAGHTRSRDQLLVGWQLLRMDKAELALEHLRVARVEGAGHWPDWWGLGQEALALQAAGREREADLALAELERRTKRIPGLVQKSYPREIRGELAAARGDFELAIAELTLAEERLPPLDLDVLRILFPLASAYLQAGQPERAAERFRRVTEPQMFRSMFPVEYARSLYFLGHIHEARGEARTARDYYQHFVDLWGDGDLDRDRVEHARRFLAAS